MPQPRPHRNPGASRCRALALALALAGCTPGPELGGYDIPRDPAVASAPWPELIDVPDAPARGVFTDAVPDPAQGEAVLADLRAEAARMRARIAELSPPVLTEAERRRLTGR